MSMSKSEALKLLQEHLQHEWLSLTEEDITFEPLEGGLINTLNLVTRKSDNYKLIIRKYGGGSWDSEHVRKFRIPDACQSLIANEVSRLSIGPKLLCVFEGGRMEEYIDSHPLTPEEFYQDDILTDIATNAAIVHNIDLPVTRTMNPLLSDLVSRYAKFYEDIGNDRKLFIDKYQDVVTELDADKKIFEEMVYHDFSSDLSKIKSKLDKKENKRIGIVLWDNNFLNCLIRNYHNDGDKKLKSVLIDYEYAQYYYTSYDCASRFINIMINYTGDGRDKLTGFKILPYEKRRLFIKQYLITCYKLEKSLDAVTDQVIDDFMAEVDLFMLIFMIMVLGFIHGWPKNTLDTDSSWLYVCIEIFKEYKTFINDFLYQEMLENPSINPPADSGKVNSACRINIVPGVPEDAHQVYQLLQQHYRYHSAKGIPDDWPVTEDMIRESVGSFSNGEKYFELVLAKDDAKIVGEIIYHKLFSFYLGKVISLSQILVDENYRGRGVGKKMMIQLCRIAENENAIIQWRTREWNVGAQKFYESIGATVINETIGLNSDMKHIGMQLDRDAIKALANEDL